eukprot:TRINITY_DN5013_c0_g1_i11.p1 TRINITY_DN5013_c0_g1~~TRINITY_DN5013_c0_g1_i11.p1  ORF type:complete len:328 (+),score=48.74 TRINITY_DN5013_c0_g1_i11:89-985(+)
MSENAFLRSLGRPLSCVSPSPTIAPGFIRDVNGNRVPYLPARELTTDEIRGRLVEDFASAAKAAIDCGFDYVEIHAAHGYLFDQFFCDTTNLRTDAFGTQTIENRMRAFILVLERLLAILGPGRVSVRISPTYNDTFVYNGCKDSNPEETYKAIITKLNQYPLAYLLVTEPRWNGSRNNFDVWADQSFKLPLRNTWIKDLYRSSPVIGSSSFTPTEAERAVSEGIYDAVAFGRFFISNPDLVDRIKHKQTLNVYDTSTFYLRDDVKGYVDYPTYDGVVITNFPQIPEEGIGSKILAKL